MTTSDIREKQKRDMGIADEPVLVAPIVHLNGTSKERLLDALGEAWNALTVTAYDALKETAPNGRDYYPVPGLLEKATDQHMRRLKALDELAEEISQLMELVDAQ